MVLLLQPASPIFANPAANYASHAVLLLITALIITAHLTISTLMAPAFSSVLTTILQTELQDYVLNVLMDAKAASLQGLIHVQNVKH